MGNWNLAQCLHLHHHLIALIFSFLVCLYVLFPHGSQFLGFLGKKKENQKKISVTLHSELYCRPNMGTIASMAKRTSEQEGGQ